MFLDLTKPDHAYLFGFIQADGHLRQGIGRKGRLTIELMAEDRWILDQFRLLAPYYSSVRLRERATNFRLSYRSAAWTVSALEFREELTRLGMPSGAKSRSIAPPLRDIATADYFRGWVDADGSLGFTSSGRPFLTLVTASAAIASAYVEFICSVIGRQKEYTRNTRDQIFNICVFVEDAQQVAAALYYDGSLALPRKAERARLIREWIRPSGIRRVASRRRWTKDEDARVRTGSISEAAAALARTPQSIMMRRWRLQKLS